MGKNKPLILLTLYIFTFTIYWFGKEFYTLKININKNYIRKIKFSGNDTFFKYRFKACYKFLTILSMVSLYLLFDYLSNKILKR